MRLYMQYWLRNFEMGSITMQLDLRIISLQIACTWVYWEGSRLNTNPLGAFNYRSLSSGMD